MIPVDVKGWKRFVEGRRRGDIGPFKQHHRVDGPDCIKEFLNGSRVAARMTVFDSNTDKSGDQCDRLFEVTKKIYDATVYIYIPTAEEWERWGDEDQGLEGQDPISRAGEIDPGWLK